MLTKFVFLGDCVTVEGFDSFFLPLNLMTSGVSSKCPFRQLTNHCTHHIYDSGHILQDDKKYIQNVGRICTG